MEVQLLANGLVMTGQSENVCINVEKIFVYRKFRGNYEGGSKFINSHTDICIVVLLSVQIKILCYYSPVQSNYTICVFKYFIFHFSVRF